jgi:iron(III) transport system substrate-binding protein
MRLLTTLATALTLSLGASAAYAQENATLNMLCSAGTVYCEALARNYQKSTGTKVNMVAKSTGEVLAQIIAEKNNPKTDLWYGGTGDPHLQAAEQDLLLEYRSTLAAQQHDWALAQAKAGNYKTIGVYLGPLGFSYNAELVVKKAIAAPQCWKDLIKPEYKGEIQVANPNSSGTAYVVIATLVQIMGEEAAFDYMKKLHKNISQYTRSGSAPVRNAARGENTIGLSFISDVVSEIANGFPVKWATPCEGTGYEIGSMSIVKGARNTDAAKKFYDWALTAAVQHQTHTDSKSPQYASNKAVAVFPGMPKLNEIKFIDYDFAKYGSVAVRKGLLTRWDKEIGSLVN